MLKNTHLKDKKSQENRFVEVNRIPLSVRDVCVFVEPTAHNGAGTYSVPPIDQYEQWAAGRAWVGLTNTRQAGLVAQPPFCSLYPFPFPILLLTSASELLEAELFNLSTLLIMCCFHHHCAFWFNFEKRCQSDCTYWICSNRSSGLLIFWSPATLGY